MKSPKRTVTSRGFTHMEPIEGHHGSQVRVYESSLATEPSIWLAAREGPSNLHEVAVSLTLDGVKELEQQLRWLRKNHYQLR